MILQRLDHLAMSSQREKKGKLTSRLLSVLEEFSENTSAHGPPKVGNNNSS